MSDWTVVKTIFRENLSGGQQQRVGIARSLAIEPDIWFLDEPFSALDPLIRREMQDEFLRLQDMLGKTIVFITHDFDEALRLADRIAIMKDGAVEQCDTPDKIVLNPATEYVAKFTEEIDKARVVHAGVLARADLAAEGEPVTASATIQSLARRLINDPAPANSGHRRRWRFYWRDGPTTGAGRPARSGVAFRMAVTADTAPVEAPRFTNQQVALFLFILAFAIAIARH